MDEARRLHHTLVQTNAKVDEITKDVRELTERVLKIANDVEDVVQLNERVASVVWGGMDARAGFVSRITAVEQHIISLQHMANETRQQSAATAAFVLTNSHHAISQRPNESNPDVSQVPASGGSRAGFLTGLISGLAVLGGALYQLIQLLSQK